MNHEIQTKQTDRKTILFSTLWLLILTGLIGTGAACAQIVTHKPEIKLPGRLANVPQLDLNDSGLGATDLDHTEQMFAWKQRFIVMVNRLYAMEENGDGTARYGTARLSDIQFSYTGVVERHINTNSSFPNESSLFGMIGAGNRYNLVTH